MIYSFLHGSFCIKPLALASFPRSARRAEEQIDARVAEVAQSLQQLEAGPWAKKHRKFTQLFGFYVR